jgi:hypothetical protein
VKRHAKALFAVLLALLCLGATAAFALQTHKHTGDIDPSPANNGGVPNYGANEGNGGFGTVSGLAVDLSGADLYVTDSAGSASAGIEGSGAIHRFEADGTYEDTTDGAATTPGSLELGEPADVAVDSSGTGSDGNFYVTDAGHGAVDAFDASGAVIASFGDTEPSPDGQLHGAKTGPGSFGFPCALAVDQSNGNLLISDRAANRVWVYDSSGKFLNAVTDAALSEPCGIATTLSGDFYVKVGGGRVLRFNKASGSEYNSAGAFYAPDNNTPADSSDDQPAATDVAVDPGSGHVFVDEAERIGEFESSGGAVSVFGQGVISGSNGIAFDATNAKLYASTPNAVHVFGPLVTLPDATTGGLGEVTGTTAILEGSVDPAGGPEAQCEFEYGTSTAYGNTAPCEPAGPYSGFQAVSAELGGLNPATEYHYRLHATSAETGPGAEANGADRSFSTDGPPIVEGSEGGVPPIPFHPFASEVDIEAATLHAKINPAGADTTYRFEYVEQAGFEAGGFAGASKAPVPDGDVGSGSTLQAVSQNLTGLSADTKYEFRLVATNAAGTVPSLTRSFTTFAKPAPPAPGSFPGQGFLPDNRAWEMVSPPEKNGGAVMPTIAHTRVAADGSAASFSSLSAFGDAIGTGTATQYLALRSSDPNPGDNGWETHAITPPQPPAPLAFKVGGEIDPRYVRDFSPDLDRGVFLAAAPLTADPGVANVVNNIYLRDDLRTPGHGNYEVVSACPLCDATETPLPPLPPSDIFATLRLTPVMAAASPDFGHIAFESRRNLTADAPAQPPFCLPEFPFIFSCKPRLYEWDHGAVRFVGRVPTSVQSLAVSATGGSFTLSFEGQNTSPIPFDATAAAVEAELNALASIGGLSPQPGSVAVSGGPGDASGSSPYLVSFGGALAQPEPAIPLISADGSGLSGGGAEANVAIDERSNECDDTSGPACVAAAVSAAGANASEEPTPHAVSDGSDGHSRIFFSERTSGSEAGAGNLYMRLDHTVTMKLNASEREIPDTPAPANYYDASSDGERIFFSTSEQLTDEPAVGGGEESIYMYDASRPASDPHNLTLISTGDSGGFSGSGGNGGVLGVSEDGRYVYFASLAGTRTKLYLWHDGDLTELGLGPEVGLDLWENVVSNGKGALDPGRQAAVTPDGRHFLFSTRDGSGVLSSHGGEDYDQAGHREFYLYSAETNTLRCASCNPSGAPATADAITTKFEGLTNFPATLHLSHPVSADGRYVFFSSAEKLVAEDTNGVSDAYEYDSQTERVHLLSSGEDPRPSFFLDASTSGKDVFFTTSERLSGWDHDNLRDLYDARIDGGFPEPSPAPASCQGDACQPAPVSLNDPTPASAALAGPGNPVKHKKHRHKRHRRHGAKQHKRTGNQRRAGR